MKKFLVICFAVCSLFLLSLNHPASAMDTQKSDKPESVQFTDAQKAELAKIQQQILADKKKLIEKYVEFGALSKEEADKMFSHFEKHYKMMEEHNFQIPPHRPHTQHKSN
ncbi:MULTISPECIES: YckD family protein [Peribacillus]|uniref:YckD family protein n=1 Tax=Peribacillus TaxID=2675229 RepID=UPI001911814F|nr:MULTISPECIES: YckD family protein [unclassified Peribacillus]MBK5442039.1 YckD family protein [Peribacillus sp. TH24]MBK5463185.1 YckD family protein [Peribacillus sp. TH27]MBK5501429.1 YckD family protein [Peribacillus sp. TH14]